MGKPYKPLAEGVKGKAPSNVINAPETVKDGKRLAVVLNRLMTWDFGNKVIFAFPIKNILFSSMP